MQPQTIQLLNQLNHQFYQTIATSFDATRSAAWNGWLPLVPYIKDAESRSVWQVLDVG